MEPTRSNTLVRIVDNHVTRWAMGAERLVQWGCSAILSPRDGGDAFSIECGHRHKSIPAATACGRAAWMELPRR